MDRVRSLVLCLGVAPICAARAQTDPVRILTCLSHDAQQTVERHLEHVLEDPLAVTFENIDVAELVARYPSGLDVDVLCGVDAQLCEIAANDGRLATHPDLPTSYCTDPDGRYFAPWAVGWVLVSRDAPRRPATLEELVSPGFHELNYGVCAPVAAPSLWTGWLRQLAAMGSDEVTTFRWLTSLDARIATYRPSLATLEFGFESGSERAVWLPTDRAARLLTDGRIAGLRADVLREGTPLTPLGVATVAASPRASATALVFAALRDPALAAALATEHGIWTAEVAALGAPHETWWRSVVPYAPIEAGTCLRTFDRWRSEVRGRGAGAEQLEFGLGIGVTLVFFGIVWWMYRRVEREEVADGRTL